MSKISRPAEYTCSARLVTHVEYTRPLHSDTVNMYQAAQWLLKKNQWNSTQSKGGSENQLCFVSLGEIITRLI